MSRRFTGIEIGTNSLKIAVLNRNAVQRTVSEFLPDGLIVDGNIPSPSALGDFIRDTARRNGIRGGRCAFVLPFFDMSFVTKILHVPAWSAEEFKLNFPYEFRDLVPDWQEGHIFDYSVLDSVPPSEENPSGELCLLGVAAKSETVEFYRDILRHAGFHLSAAIPPERAYVNLMRRGMASGGSCIVDVGHSRTRLYIFSGAKLEAVHTFDIGGTDLDAAISEAFGIDIHVAHSYKLTNYNDALNLEGCETVYLKIASSVVYALNRFLFTHPGAQIDRAYLCGGAALSPVARATAAAAEEEPLTCGMQVLPISELLQPGSEPSASLSISAAAIGAAIQ